MAQINLPEILQSSNRHFTTIRQGDELELTQRYVRSSPRYRTQKTKGWCLLLTYCLCSVYIFLFVHRSLHKNAFTQHNRVRETRSRR